MNFAQLQSEVREVVRDDSDEIVSNIPTYINEAVNLIVEMGNLPGFKSFTTVTTTVSQAYSSLPTASSGKVTYVGDSSGELSYVTLEELLSLYPKMDEEGDVKYVAIDGSLLYYQPIPEDATLIYIIHRRTPTEMVNSDDEPDGIPSYHYLDGRPKDRGIHPEAFGGIKCQKN